MVDNLCPTCIQRRLPSCLTDFIYIQTLLAPAVTAYIYIQDKFGITVQSTVINGTGRATLIVSDLPNGYFTPFAGSYTLWISLVAEGDGDPTPEILDVATGQTCIEFTIYDATNAVSSATLL